MCFAEGSLDFRVVGITWPRETPRGADTARQTTSALQIFRPVLLPRLLSQELPRCDPLGAKVSAFSARKYGTQSTPPLEPEVFRFRPRSVEYLHRCHRKRYAPNRGEWLLPLADVQNSPALTVQSNPMPSVPLPQDYAQCDREPPQNIVLRLIRAYHSVPLPVRSLLQSPRDKRKCRQSATRKGPHGTDKRSRAHRALRPEGLRRPNARFECLLLRAVVPIRNCQNSKVWPPKPCGLLLVSADFFCSRASE